MSRPEKFGEALHIRFPRGTRRRVNVARGSVAQADFVRELMLTALADYEAKNGITPDPSPSGVDSSEIGDESSET